MYNKNISFICIFKMATVDQMEDQKTHLRHILYFFFRKGLKPVEAHREICAVYGDSAISCDSCERWFVRFRYGNVSLKDSARSGRPITTDEDQILSIIKSDRHISTREIAKRLSVQHSTVARRLNSLGITKKMDNLIPHELTENNLLNRVMVCQSLLKRNSMKPFLKRMITGDEKWVMYNNIKRRRSWCGPTESPQSVAKPDCHSKKVLLCIWWDWKGVIYYDLLPSGQTINATRYCAQLEELKEAVLRKRPELRYRRNVVFHVDNARPHVALATKQKLKNFGWEVMQHPPYSPDIAPSDYHLFRSLQNHLNSQRFNSMDEIKKVLNGFFEEKPQSFYESGIIALPQRWQQIIEQKGNYI